MRNILGEKSEGGVCMCVHIGLRQEDTQREGKSINNL